MQPLRTNRLDLVPLDASRDAEPLHEMYGDPAWHQFAPADVTGDVAETHARLVRELQENGGWTWVLRVRPSVEAIGAIGLFSDQGTSIRGLTWGIGRRYWGQGLMGEAAPVVVDHLLAQPGIAGVEAWIDTRNTRSVGVARRARLDERARLARVYADHTAQQVVMARSAHPADADTLAVRPSLAVRDVRDTCQRLMAVLGLSLSFEYGDPPTFARLGVGPWSGAPGIDVSAAGEGAIAATTCSVDIGIPTDVVHARAVEAGWAVLSAPVDQPWHAREFAFTLPEGHRIRVIGPARPAHLK
ncbi:GNAT family N-acetyltransferase [Propionibacteriaceae bacterium Y2011]